MLESVSPVSLRVLKTMLRSIQLSFVVLVLLVPGMVPAAEAQTTTATCSPADMTGAWVTQPNGFFTQGPVAGPFGATGVLIFDGATRFGGVASSSFNGHVIFPFGADGSYTLTPDCHLAVFEETLRIRFDGWLANNKTEVLFFEPDATSISINHLQRQNIATCSAQSVGGIWTMVVSGYNIITQGRYASDTHMTLDGKGGLTGTAFVSTDGLITENKYTGTYTVNQDCSMNFQLLEDTGLVLGYYASLFDNTNQFYVISNNEGLVLLGYAKRP